MKTLTRIMIVLITLNLIMAGFTIAQPVPNPVEPVSVSTTNLPAGQAEVDRSQRDLVRLVRSASLSTGRRAASSGNSILVIPTQEMNTEEIVTINEDMNVMSRIIDNELNRERINKSNITWSFSGNRWMADDFATFFGGDRGNTASMYLQGYGALFLMKVDFPLSARPDIEKQEEEETEKEDVDQVWEQTRKQIYEPQETSRRRRGTERPEVKYDAEKVENLKTSLIQALKHAANIRVMKPDESVILSITGSGGTSGPMRVITSRRGDESRVIATLESGESQSKILIIRAKRSDIDTFAKGDLDLEKFREKVQILSYPLLGENVAGASTSLTLPTRPGTGTF